MSYQELGHFLTNLYDVFKELDEYSKDEVEERAMIKKQSKGILSIIWIVAYYDYNS